MMLLKTRLQNYKNKFGAKWEIIEQDYALSLILYGIAHIPDLRENLVFKGGTCLRKCYFGDYRFSQDIDLSVIDHHEYLKNKTSELFDEVCRIAQEKIKDLGESFYLICAPYQEKLACFNMVLCVALWPKT
ncbi:MAG: nucleotidyl transferase AbiEii/AbiGii toxin family protein [Alphaproteobacteria bacterium]|nr:nucleotidyl transferase AbiEii/AbiGii toxin family protein [Alphaproteobacteria bacterium]